MRAMPSPAEMIVPSSETSTPALNPSICCLRTLVISSAFSSATSLSPQEIPGRAPVSVRSDQPLAQGLEIAPQCPVVDLRPDPRARATQEGGVDALCDLHGSPGHRLQRLPQPLSSA